MGGGGGSFLIFILVGWVLALALATFYFNAARAVGVLAAAAGFATGFFAAARTYGFLAPFLA